MAYLYLILAGIFEVSWPTGFKMAQLTGDKILWITFSVVGMTFSGLLLYLAQKEIPIGAAYATWTGIGAVGTFLLGVYYFGDHAGMMSWFGVALIVGGIVCLKMATLSS